MPKRKIGDKRQDWFVNESVLMSSYVLYFPRQNGVPFPRGFCKAAASRELRRRIQKAVESRKLRVQSRKPEVRGRSSPHERDDAVSGCEVIEEFAVRLDLE